MIEYAHVLDGIVVNILVADDNWVPPGNDNEWIKVTEQNPAYIGCRYISRIGKFVGPCPYPSWKLDNNYDWQPPKPKPDFDCFWIEDEQNWVSKEIIAEAQRIAREAANQP